MRMIFHVPRALDPAARSGFHVRVPRMVQGFKDLGYEVDLVSGTVLERKKKIERISDNIEKGIRYDFLYAENATIPTLLTEPGHMPIGPRTDFGFFKYCKAKGLRLGLFYRDIYWRFPDFAEKMRFHKRIFNMLFQYYDLFQFSSIFDVLYLPTMEMAAYLPIRMGCSIKDLPPGLVPNLIGRSKRRKEGAVRFLYVGGLGAFYDIGLMAKTVFGDPRLSLTICCRENDWKQSKNVYGRYLCDRIRVVHASGDDLGEYMAEADIGCLYLQPHEWRDFAMPIKLFEYLQYGLPVLGVEGSAAGRFIRDNGVGWVIGYSDESIGTLIGELLSDDASYRQKMEAAAASSAAHSWKSRCEKVASDLREEQTCERD